MQSGFTDPSTYVLAAALPVLAGWIVTLFHSD
jgi:hypothetical protein